MRCTTFALLFTAAAEMAWAAGLKLPGLSTGSYLADFADPGGPPYTGVPRLPGPYKALNWPNWQTYGGGGGGCIKTSCGVVPNSFPIAAEYSLPYDDPVNKINTTRVSNTFGAAYNGSRVLFFDLDSLWIGCTAGLSLTINSNTYRFDGPANCTFTFTGYLDDAGRIPVAKQEFQYSNAAGSGFSFFTGLPYQKPMQVNFTKGFSFLRKLKIEASIDFARMDPLYLPVVTAPGITLDDVKYTVTNTSFPLKRKH